MIFFLLFWIRAFLWFCILYVCCLLLYNLYLLADRYKWNPFRKPEHLKPEDIDLISTNFPLYQSMTESHKLRWEKRIFWFLRVKAFKFQGVVARQHDLKLMVCASLALLTLGLSHFRLMRSLKEIVIYPDRYFSRITRQHHFGEYNPGFNRVIISAEQFWKGFAISDDNRNLALHEFAHVLSFDLIRQTSWEGLRFRWGLRKIKKMLKQPALVARITDSGYFREYGMTNLQEFFAVAVENYVETPTVFKAQFPEFYDIIKSMLNFDFSEESGGPIKTAP